jgi:hypothetical protein
MTSSERQPFDPRQRFGKDERFASDLVWQDRSLGLSPGEKSAYWKLLCFGQKSGVTFIRDETVAAEIGIHARHFRSHKTRLKELGFIDWSRAEHKRCSRYVFLLHPILTGNQCAAELTGSTSASGTQSATGNRVASAAGNRSAGHTGNQSAVVKKQSEAKHTQSVPTSSASASANASFQELPPLSPLQLLSIRDPIDPRDELTHLVLSYRANYNSHDRPDLYDFQDQLLDHDLQDLELATWDPDYSRVAAIQEEARRKIGAVVDEDTLRSLTLDPDDYYVSFHAAIVDAIGGGFEVRSKHWESIGVEALRCGLVEACAPSKIAPEIYLREIFGAEVAS